MTNNKLPEWRTVLDKCVENYQSTRAWYEENRDSPAALDDMERAEDQLAKFVKKYGFSIVLSLLDEIDELQEREQIRREHAEWSDATFGDVGPIGPLKHLSKEALEAAADPSDPLEWADMQFLLWDAQRRAGITDEQITQAMVEKLAVNKRREWPEPKDGEPRLHIKEQTAPVVPDDGRAEFEAWMLKKWGRERQEYDFAMGKFLHGENYADSYTRHMWKAWTESRAAMLQSKYRDLSQPVDPQISEYEKIMLRAGWVMVPVEPTDEMIAAAMDCEDVLFNSDESFCVQFGNIYEAMLAAAPQQEGNNG